VLAAVLLGLASPFPFGDATVYASVPSPPEKLLESRGPHPVCSLDSLQGARRDLCLLHQHLALEPLPSKKLKRVAKAVLSTLNSEAKTRLHARLLAVKAWRSETCLADAGSAHFAEAESQMIVGRYRQALLAYERAIRLAPRQRSAALVPELLELIRRPYAQVAASKRGATTVFATGEHRTVDLVPPILRRAAVRLARAAGVADAAIEPAPRALAERPRAPRAETRLNVDRGALLVWEPGARGPLRLRAEAAQHRLRLGLKPNHPEVHQAARLVGALGIDALREELTFLSNVDDPLVQTSATVGLLGLAHPDDQAMLIKWLKAYDGRVTPALNAALARFGAAARGRLRVYGAGSLPPAVLAPLLSRSQQFELRGWYESLIGHADLRVRILAQAALRATKPDDRFTRRLRNDPAPSARCAARNLIALKPQVRAATPVRKTVVPTDAPSDDDEAPDLVPDGEGSIEIPADAVFEEE
jgi:tetratricopeptide (TPR) repeat protein